MATAWGLLDEKQVTLFLSEEIAGWNLLDEKEVTLLPSEEIGEWNLLDELEVTLIPSEEIAGWSLLDEKEVTLLPVLPPDGVPPEEAPFPWKWILIGTGGIVLVGTGVALITKIMKKE